MISTSNLINGEVFELLPSLAAEHNSSGSCDTLVQQPSPIAACYVTRPVPLAGCYHPYMLYHRLVLIAG